MVVCKFFQAGYCRYGKNCRFEHVYGSKYTYHANPQIPATQPAPVPTQAVGVTDEQLVKQVQSDVQAALRGGQWIVSCYSPFKEKPIFPGITDLSPEEARLFIYEAKNTNNIEQAVAYINNLFKETRLKYEHLLQPNVNIIKVLRSLYKGEPASSPFSNDAQTGYGNSNNAAASIFHSAVQTAPVFSHNVNNAQSIFSQAQNSIFNPQAADPAKQLFAQANDPNAFGQSQSQNIFAQQNQTTDAKSIFASAAQNNYNQTNPSDIFASAAQNSYNQTNPSDIFASAAQNNYNQTNPSDIFASANQNIFAREQRQSQNPSAFGQGNIFQTAQSPSSVFGQVSTKPRTEADPSVYSKMEELSDVDLEAFKGDSFQLGYIPECPPPHELCSAQLRTQLF